MRLTNVVRSVIAFTAIVTPLCVAIGCEARSTRAGPERELLPGSLAQVHLGSTVQDLLSYAPATTFTPYDGLQLRLAEDPSGFDVLHFSTGRLFPERQPSNQEIIKEIHLRGDNVSENVRNRVRKAFRGQVPVHRCVASVGVEVLIWEDGHEKIGAELTVFPDSSSRRTLTIFLGPWKGDPLTSRSLPGTCTGPAG
jgi:hypothetical protein